MEASQMSVITLEGVVENGRIKLNTSVNLPENTKVYVVIPDTEIAQEVPVYDISLGKQAIHIFSPHIAPPGRASDLRLEVITEAADDGL
jgi:predicted DNA-binding antitoxin AbrB/MazE fold protein